jgi:hypothetical protein
MRWRRLAAIHLLLLVLAHTAIDPSAIRAMAAASVAAPRLPGAGLRLVLHAARGAEDAASSRGVQPCRAPRPYAGRWAERQQRAAPNSGGTCAAGVGVCLGLAEGVVMRLRGAGKAFKQRKVQKAEDQRAMLKAAAKVGLWA